MSDSEDKLRKIDSIETLDYYVSDVDNKIDNFYISDIPDACKNFPCFLGIDEAGRGPVLGPMVYGTSFAPLNELQLLIELGCADSKTLNEEKRDEIFQRICEKRYKIGWGVKMISPVVISNSMLSRTKYSLNQLSMDAAIELIKAAEEKGVNIEYIYVDTVGPPEKYQAYLKRLFPKYKITVEKKADSTFPIVSAASICAKVVRDHMLQKWKFSEGFDIGHKQFGSGYPADPVTKKFLEENVDLVFGFPQLVRFSWSTASNMLEEKAYNVEWDEDEDNSPDPKVIPITSFFKSSKETSRKQTHSFFKERNLTRNVEF